MPKNDIADVKLFRERAEKLFASQAKYQGGVPVASFRESADSGVIDFKANTPDVDEVQNIAIKFRFFYADKEPTQFEKILSKTRRCVADEWACNYIDLIGDQYKEAMKDCDTSERFNCPITNRQIINLWFNSEFFHSNREKRIELNSIHDSIGEGASLFQLHVAMLRCSSIIRTFYYVVHALEEGCEFVYTPNHHFRKQGREK